MSSQSFHICSPNPAHHGPFQSRMIPRDAQLRSRNQISSTARRCFASPSHCPFHACFDTFSYLFLSPAALRTTVVKAAIKAWNPTSFIPAAHTLTHTTCFARSISSPTNSSPPSKHRHHHHRRHRRHHHHHRPTCLPITVPQSTASPRHAHPAPRPPITTSPPHQLRPARYPSTHHQSSTRIRIP